MIEAAGGHVRIERRPVPRNRWRVTAERFRAADRQTAVRDADLVVAQSQMAIIEKALERAFPNDERALSVRRDLPRAEFGAALALPNADTEAMQLHLNEISRHVADGAHAVLLMDRAGWHTTSALA